MTRSASRSPPATSTTTASTTWPIGFADGGHRSGHGLRGWRRQCPLRLTVVGLTATGDRVQPERRVVRRSPRVRHVRRVARRRRLRRRRRRRPRHRRSRGRTSDDDVANQGAVNVLYGIGGSALSTGGQRAVHPGGIGRRAPGERRRLRLVAGGRRLRQRQRGDLAVGVPGRTSGTSGTPGASTSCTASGVRPRHRRQPVWHQDQDGIDGVGEEGDTFGSSQASGDFDGDGFDDLASARPERRSATTSARAP